MSGHEKGYRGERSTKASTTTDVMDLTASMTAPAMEVDLLPPESDLGGILSSVCLSLFLFITCLLQCMPEPPYPTSDGGGSGHESRETGVVVNFAPKAGSGVNNSQDRSGLEIFG